MVTAGDQSSKLSPWACRDQAQGELQGQMVSGEERVRMQEALHRLNHLDDASESSGGSEDDSDEFHEGADGQAAATLRKKQRHALEALAERIEQVRCDPLQVSYLL